MDEPVKLKHCPFCGKSPRFAPSERGFTATLRVACDSCGGCSGAITYSIRENDLDEERDPVPPLRRKTEVALYWNTRAAAAIGEQREGSNG